MSDLLQRGSDWLADKLKDYGSRQVEYQRGAMVAIVQATIGRTLLKLDDGLGGVRMEWTDRDYLIQAIDLDSAGITLPPQRGDRITELRSGQQYERFEVLTPGQEPHWRWSDAYFKLLRIHTKRIGSETR
jgi:hypothetical protein